MSKNEVSLVVIERGARWPAFARDGGTPDCRVLSQQQGETTNSFAERVVARLRTLSALGTAVQSSVIALGGDRSEAAVTARYRIARALVTARPLHGSAELVFAAPGAAPRHDVFELAGALCSTLTASDFAVRVRSSGDTGAVPRAA
jgi:hypothetical protein